MSTLKQPDYILIKCANVVHYLAALVLTSEMLLVRRDCSTSWVPTT